MPLVLRNLTAICYAHGLTHWSYHTPDSRRELESSTYWADAADSVNPGDWIFVSHEEPNGPGSGHSLYGVAGGKLPRLRLIASSFADPRGASATPFIAIDNS